MPELGLVLLILIGLAVLGWIVSLGLSSTALVQIGLIILALGLAEGVPTGLYYHYLLFRKLRQNGPPPPRWWLSPTQHHAALGETDRKHVVYWFFLGGAGFMLCLVGGLLALSGAFMGVG
jgi:hypothetical protein